MRSFIVDQAAPWCDEIKVDNMGSVIAWKHSKTEGAPTVMIDAHMDEVGFLVQYIRDDGMIRYLPVGGVDAAVCVSKRVRIGKNAVPGVIGCKAVHLQEAGERSQALKHSQLLIDIGAKDKKDALTKVKVGDYIKADGQEGTVKAVTVFYTFLTTPDNKVVTLPNGSLTGTAVVNYTANPTRLLMQTYTASYDAPVEKVKAVLLETARANPMVLADPAPMARLAKHGDSALEYTLRVWCNSADYWPLNFDLMEQVRDAFDKAGIEIPYPQMDVHTR